jgi:Asp-tRNA(Asn)/Glu-tRNA(Gln) amidotransferase B subunit
MAIIYTGDIMKKIRHIEYNENLIQKEDAEKIDRIINEIIIENEKETASYKALCRF